MQRRLFLDVVVGQNASVLQLLPCENEPLLIWRDSLLVLNLRFYIVDRVRRFDLEGDGLTGESLHENLHDEPVGCVSYFTYNQLKLFKSIFFFLEISHSRSYPRFFVFGFTRYGTERVSPSHIHRLMIVIVVIALIASLKRHLLVVESLPSFVRCGTVLYVPHRRFVELRHVPRGLMCCHCELGHQRITM